jgi:hypothetical protein
MSDQRERVEEASFIIKSGGGTIISPFAFNPIRFKSSDPTLSTRLSNRVNATVISEAENGIQSILV